jgi:hypothetical protein
MATNVSINTDIVSVCQGIGQIQELNKLLSTLHALPLSQVGCPVTIKIVKEYTSLKICTHVLAIISLKLNMAYHARCQDSFVTDVNVLILWLEAANLNIKQTNGMLRQYVDRELGKHRNST